ncbi:MAG: ATP-binding protein [Deltaproteobacteria bacterium]|nr:ATP-binding protein [Deltaproteobacteria bacterium]
MNSERSNESYGYPYTYSPRGDRKWSFKKDQSLTKGISLDFGSADFYFEIDYDDLSNAGIGAVALKRFLQSRGLGKEDLRKVGVCAYEAEVNVVIHSTGTGNMYCFTNGRDIILLVLDNGIGIADLHAAMVEGFSTASDEVRDKGFGAGRGINNMKRFSDDFVMLSENGLGTRVEMRFRVA